MLVFMVSIVVNNTWVNCLGWFFVWEIRRAVGWSRGALGSATLEIVVC